MEFTEDGENVDPEIPEEQKTILDRMRRLSGENGEELNPFSVSSRLNFGLPGPDKGSHLGGKPGQSVKPPPGFLTPSSLPGTSSAGIKLAGLGASSGSCLGAPLNALASSSRQDTHSGPSLGMLASSHLTSSGQPSLGMLASSHLASQSSSAGANKPSLGMLASSHLSNAQSSSESSGFTLGGSKPSLGMLASSHLSTASGPSTLGSSSSNKPSLGMLASSHLTSNPLPSSLVSSTDKLSLGGLASSHLSSTPMLSSLGSSGAKPSLSLLASSHLSSSGRTESTVGQSVHGVKCVSPVQSDINLLSALKLSSGEEIKLEEVVVKKKQEEDLPNIDIFVSKRTFGKIKSILRKRGRTPFALPLTRYL